MHVVEAQEKQCNQVVQRKVVIASFTKNSCSNVEHCKA